MDVASIGLFVHEYTPHSRIALYLASTLSAVVAIGFVWLRGGAGGGMERLSAGWVVRTAATAAPLPIYILLILMPLDANLADILHADPIVVAIAGLYGIVEALRDIFEVGRAGRTAD